MAIILKFKDTEIERSNPKAARAYLRNNGMNVRQATKDGDIWYFGFALASKVEYIKFPNLKIKPQPNVDWSKTPLEKATEPKYDVEIPKLPKNLVHRPQGQIKNLPVAGADLQPGDIIVEAIPDRNLTVDYRGFHTIEHSPDPITKHIHTYPGFKSVESGGLLSYRIDPEALYDVIRRE